MLLRGRAQGSRHLVGALTHDDLLVLPQGKAKGIRGLVDDERQSDEVGCDTRTRANKVASEFRP